MLLKKPGIILLKFKKNKHSIFVLITVTFSHRKNFDLGRFLSHARQPFLNCEHVPLNQQSFAIFVKIHLNTFYVPKIFSFQNCYQKFTRRRACMGIPMEWVRRKIYSKNIYFNCTCPGRLDFFLSLVIVIVKRHSQFNTCL